MKFELDLELPEELIDPELKQQLTRLAKEDIVLRLFEGRKIASGLATRLLGLTRRQFMEICQGRGIALVDYTAEDLKQDMAAMRELEKRQAEPADDDRRR